MTSQKSAFVGGYVLGNETSSFSLKLLSKPLSVRLMAYEGSVDDG